MYENIKSCVKVNGTCSNLFPCQIGLRQGENLSPVIFSLYLNDLYDFFNNSDLLNGTNLPLPNHTSNVIYDYLQIFLLLYADDTVLISDTAEDLQNALNLYERYCQEWHLKVNNEKSKIVVFSRGRNRLYNFTFAHQPI